MPERSASELAYELACQSINPNQYPNGQRPFELFMERVQRLDRPRVLELGTRPSTPGRSTRSEHLFPNAGEYIGTDIQAADDVDVVADVHRLSQVFAPESIDIVFTDAGFEHFKYPHLAAWEIMKVLKVGGLVFAQTHQTFPIHAVPFDYCRFSTEAMASLFGAVMGCKVHGTAYASPAAIYSRVDPNGRNAPAFLHVNVFAEKVAPTPAAYIYEFDCEV